MKQRLEVARALAVNPDILFSTNLSARSTPVTRLIMRGELLRIWQAERKTIIFVTHDIDEAVQLADRVVVMSARPASIQEIVTIDIAASARHQLAALPGTARRHLPADRTGALRYEFARKTRGNGRDSSGRSWPPALLLALWHYSVVWTATKVFPLRAKWRRESASCCGNMCCGATSSIRCAAWRLASAPRW